MSSNIRITRICQHCNKEFVAKTTMTKYCGDNCAKRAYKVRLKSAKIEASHKETEVLKNIPKEKIKEKEFLSVKESCLLLGMSRPTLYRLIDSGRLKACRISTKKTIIKRVDIDNLFKY